MLNGTNYLNLTFINYKTVHRTPTTFQTTFLNIFNNRKPQFHKIERQIKKQINEGKHLTQIVLLPSQTNY